MLLNQSNCRLYCLALPNTTARNITPDLKSGLPANLTFDEFVRAMRGGEDVNRLHPTLPLLQTMPWPLYQMMNDRDLRAIYEYLSAIPHAEPR